MQPFWNITFELQMMTQFFHPFILMYKKHPILLHVSQHGRPNRRFLSWQISTQVAVATWLVLEVLPVLISRYLCLRVDWCTRRLSLIELYIKGDLNLVPKKNMRRIPYREVVFIKCWYFCIFYKKIMKNCRKHSRCHLMTAYICTCYWRTQQNQCRKWSLLVSPHF
jgi:hypothetical protein